MFNILKMEVIQNLFCSLCGMSDMDGIISHLTPFFFLFLKQREKEEETPAGVVRTEHTLTHGSDWYNYLSSSFSLYHLFLYISRRGMLLLLLLLLDVRTHALPNAAGEVMST